MGLLLVLTYTAICVTIFKVLGTASTFSSAHRSKTIQDARQNTRIN